MYCEARCCPAKAESNLKMSPLTTPFPRYVGNLVSAVGEGMRKGRMQRGSRNHHYSQRVWVSLEQNLKEETKTVTAELQVIRRRPQRQFACLCTKNEYVRPLTTYSSTPKKWKDKSDTFNVRKALKC